MGQLKFVSLGISPKLSIEELKQLEMIDDELDIIEKTGLYYLNSLEEVVRAVEVKKEKVWYSEPISLKTFLNLKNEFSNISIFEEDDVGGRVENRELVVNNAVFLITKVNPEYCDESKLDTGFIVVKEETGELYHFYRKYTEVTTI